MVAVEGDAQHQAVLYIDAGSAQVGVPEGTDGFYMPGFRFRGFRELLVELGQPFLHLLGHTVGLGDGLRCEGQLGHHFFGV